MVMVKLWGGPGTTRYVRIRSTATYRYVSLSLLNRGSRLDRPVEWGRDAAQWSISSGPVASERRDLSQARQAFRYR